MAQGYYTLQEAAQVLGMPVDELKQMAQRGKIRSFQDRGTLRFRIQDVQELARTRGGASDPDLVLGDASLPAPKSSATPPSAARKQPSSAAKRPESTPASAPKTPARQENVPEVFDFDFDGDNVDSGADFLPLPKSEEKGKSGKNPLPTPAGSDSEIRLVPTGDDVNFATPKESVPKPPDSDVKVASDPLKPKTSVRHPDPISGSKRRSQLALDSGAQPKSKGGGSSGTRHPSPRPGSAAHPPDSGVRLVPMDSDSDVKLLGASDDVPLGLGGPSGPTDSNVRLEKVELPPADSQEGNMLLTEEINLDEEIKKQQEKEKNEPATKLKAKSALKLPAGSPFELSDSDLELPSELKASSGPKTPTRAQTQDGDSSEFELAIPGSKKDDGSSDFDLSVPGTPPEGSSDFDLLPAADESIVLEGSDSDFSLQSTDDNEQVLQGEGGELTSSTSGISLENPADGGISLEGKPADESDDFDLSLEAEATPRPQASRPVEDSDSEFELTSAKTPRPQKKAASDEGSDEIDLSLDVEDDGTAPAQDGDSEFELNLEGVDDGGSAGGAESDSEFELTLDDSGNIAVEEEAAPQVKSKKKVAAEEEEDIFETDFEVPPLEESDDATVEDSELESSDFDIALDDSDLANEEESGSQVVALDEEADEVTVTDEEEEAVVDDVEGDEESSDFSDLDQDVDGGEEGEVEVEDDEAVAGETRTVVKEKLIPPAPWGVLPVVFMLPCVVIMFLVGILGYEAVQSSAGGKPPGVLTTTIAGWFGEKVTLK